MNQSPPPAATPLIGLMALILSVCWLLPNHHAPWTDFYSDAWAALVLCVVGTAVLWHSRRTAPLAWHMLPVLTLAWAGVVWIQYASGLIQTLGVAWIGALYLAGLTLALVVGAAWERWRPGECADFLFMAVLAGATGSFLIQLMQWLALDPGAAFWLFIPAPRTRFYANLGQPNQLASLLCLGVLACAWLHERRYLSGWLAWAWSLPLALGIALTESRTSWVVVFLFLVALLSWRRRLSMARTLLAGVIGWAAVFVLCVVSLPHVDAWLGRTSELRHISSNEIRFELWAKLLKALLHHPWVGYGWTQTSLAQFTSDPFDVPTGGTLRHAHNLFLDLGVGLGVPLGLALSLILTLWMLRAVFRVQQMKHLLMLLFVVTLGVHAMLEFPLHYAYFLLPIGLMAGALNAALDFKPLLRSPRWVAGVAMALTVLGLGITTRDYLRVENAFFGLRFEQERLAPSGSQAMPKVLALTHLQDMLWLARVEPTKTHSNEDLDKALRTTELLPSQAGMYKLATMYALNEQPDQAEYWIIVMIRMNHLTQRAVDDLRQQWQAQARMHPAMASVVWPP
ncbi:Wzy polymerase domain-containing protein [Ottowia sp.]|uniref:Wzy polymerase domain-containing protein n=1 Tax=Ottowia sp. TaxID=1898956 RepID=UPI003942997C